MPIVANPDAWHAGVNPDYAESCIRLIEFIEDEDHRFFEALLEEAREKGLVTLWTNDPDDEEEEEDPDA